MSFKAKDLHFDSSQPAFLRRLRGEMTGEDSARHERPIPRNKRMKQDDEDDAPTYVLEDTNQSLTKAEYEVLVSGKDPKEVSDTPQENNEDRKPKDDDEEAKTKDKIAEVGRTAKKRKVAKVIGKEEGVSKEDSANLDRKAPKKTKKKAKTVKLTFGDEEE